MIQNERGLTLIEILVSLTILSVIGVVIWNVFFQGFDYSKKAATQNTIQQEANILTTRLTKIHQTSEVYEIDSSACRIKVDYTSQDGTNKEEIFNHTNYCFSTDFSGTVEPNNEDRPLTITIYDKDDTQNHLVLDTLLYRLKGDSK